MPMALEAVEESLRQQGKGELSLHPRRRLKLPDNAFLHYMAAADPVHGYMGMKFYTVARGAARFVVPLFRSTTGEMAALIEADALGQIRTGAASGVATKYLANSNARSACIIGTGYQARTQLEAVAAVRRLERVRAFGRDPERRAQFCREMSARIGVAVEPADSGEEAVRGAEIVITATSAMKIVLEGAWLSPGTHINAIGANSRKSANWTMQRSAAATYCRGFDRTGEDGSGRSDSSVWGGRVALGHGARAFRNRRGKDAGQNQRKPDHAIQIHWDRHLGSGCGRARL